MQSWQANITRIIHRRCKDFSLFFVVINYEGNDVEITAKVKLTKKNHIPRDRTKSFFMHALSVAARRVREMKKTHSHSADSSHVQRKLIAIIQSVSSQLNWSKFLPRTMRRSMLQLVSVSNWSIWNGTKAEKQEKDEQRNHVAVCRYCLCLTIDTEACAFYLLRKKRKKPKQIHHQIIIVLHTPNTFDRMRCH